MEITREPPDPTPGPEAWFTGEVEMVALASPDPPARVRVLEVRFAPRARTAWHTHPFGQVLHVLEGTARLQREGAPVEEVPAGGTVWFDADERHWHGAGADRSMTHIAIQEAGPDGSTTTWAEHVSDAEYEA